MAVSRWRRRWSDEEGKGGRQCERVSLTVWPAGAWQALICRLVLRKEQEEMASRNEVKTKEESGIDGAVSHESQDATASCAS